MRNNLNFFDIYQNTSLSTIAIHSFVLGYYNVAKHRHHQGNFPPLRYIFFVLPIIYDNRTMESIRNELYTTLHHNKEFTLGLQERAQKMSSQTFEALNLGLTKNIINIDKNYNILINDRYLKDFTKNMGFSNNVISSVQTSSKRLGGIFAKKEEKVLQYELNILF